MIQIWIEEKNTTLCCDWAMTDVQNILSSCPGEAEKIAMLRKNMETNGYFAANEKMVAKFYDDDLELSERKISLEEKIIACYDELIEGYSASIEKTQRTGKEDSGSETMISEANLYHSSLMRLQTRTTSTLSELLKSPSTRTEVASTTSS